MARKKTEPDVKVGQIWKDMDYRMEGRLLRILEVGETHAIFETVGKKNGQYVASSKRRIRGKLTRFNGRSSGYGFVE